MIRGGMCFPAQCPLERPDGSHAASWARLNKTIKTQWKNIELICDRVISSYTDLHSSFYSKRGIFRWLFSGPLGHNLVSSLLWGQQCTTSSQVPYSSSTNYVLTILQTTREEKKPWTQIYTVHGFLFSSAMENLNMDVYIYTLLAASCLLLTFRRVFCNLKHVSGFWFLRNAFHYGSVPLNVPSNPTWAVVLIRSFLCCRLFFLLLLRMLQE